MGLGRYIRDGWQGDFTNDEISRLFEHFEQFVDFAAQAMQRAIHALRASGADPPCMRRGRFAFHARRGGLFALAAQLFAQTFARALDREALLVEQLADRQDDFNVARAIAALIRRILARTQIRKFAFPVAEHRRLQAGHLGDFLDAVEKFAWTGRGLPGGGNGFHWDNLHERYRER